MERNVGTIIIDNLRVFARHGVLAQETVVGNTFDICIRLEFDATEAMQTDEVGNTLNYAEIIEVVKTEMKTSSKLLEHVTMRIYRALNSRYPQILSGEIAVYKVAPPISCEVGRVGFSYRW